MYAVHDSRYSGGHFGFDKTAGILKERCYWSTMSKDIHEYIKTCMACQLNAPAGQNTKDKMQPIPIPENRWEVVGVDFIGPFKETKRGNKCVLVMVDYLTRWPEAVALPDQSAHSLANALLEKTIGQWGVPRYLVSDQGKNFTSAVMASVYKMLGITRRPTTPYRPQADGLTERQNRTLKTAIRKLMVDHALDWDVLLWHAVATFRYTIQKSIGDTPFFAMLGMDPTLPLDIMMDPEVALEVQDELWRKEWLNKMKAVSKDVRAQLQAAQAKMKDYEDKGITERELNVGDIVKLRVGKRAAKRDWECTWNGPYRIQTVGEPPSANILTLGMRDDITRTFNRDKVERYFVRDDEELLLGQVADPPVTDEE